MQEYRLVRNRKNWSHKFRFHWRACQWRGIADDDVCSRQHSAVSAADTLRVAVLSISRGEIRALRSSSTAYDRLVWTHRGGTTDVASWRQSLSARLVVLHALTMMTTMMPFVVGRTQWTDGERGRSRRHPSVDLRYVENSQNYCPDDFVAVVTKVTRRSYRRS